ncbi:MAG: hypothetical protein EA394_06800 [Bacteroidia bacterium]|nr:MAG: hypothetical protein EA394_06800 [Bacteroidia bacterium]
MMNGNDWPLVFFTLISQISVGILLSGFFLWISLKNSDASSLEIFKKLLLIAGLGTMVVALILSFLHLANPQHAIYAFSNLRASWLSREIILASMYLLTLAICFASLQYNIPHRNLFGPIFLASLIFGIFLVWSMARVYMIPTVPLWNTPATPIAFFHSTIILGAGATLVILSLLASKNPDFTLAEKMQSLLFYLIAITVIIGLLNTFLLQPDIQTLGSSFPVPEVTSLWKNVRIVFLLAGFSILTYWFAFQLSSESGSSSVLIYLGTACLLISEIAARYLFYASYFRVGV